MSLSPEQKMNLVKEALQRAVKTSHLGEEKKAEFQNNLKLLTAKMDMYIAIAQIKTTTPEQFADLRLQLSNHLDSALDAIDFVHHSILEDDKFRIKMMKDLES